MERLTFTIPEVAELLGISRSAAYELVAAGTIPAVPIGSRRRLVARHTIEELIGEPIPSFPNDSPPSVEST